LPAAFFGSPEEIDNYLAKVAASNQRVIQQASTFLTPEQLATFKTVLSNGSVPGPLKLQQ